MNHLLISLQPDLAGQIEPLSYPLSLSQLLLDHDFPHASINIIPRPRTGRVITTVLSLLTHFPVVLHDSGVMAQDPEPTIASESKACIRHFEEICSIISSLGSQHPTELSPHTIPDEFGRFRVWAGNIGALQSGTSSLDKRLKKAPHVQRQVLQLLDDLNYTLRES